MLFGIKDFDFYVVIGVLILFGAIETISGYLHRSKRTSSDWIQEFGSFALLGIVTKPGVVALVYSLGVALLAPFQGAFATWNMVLLFFFYMLIDDVLQYWYHRFAHEYEWLWKLHRPHHQAEEMGFFVAYRNAALYYAIMPNIWWVAIITFLGGGKVVAFGLIIKQLIIIGSHSPTKWDQYLYRIPALNPVISVLERIIVTPAFHFAHHGKSMADDISDPNGNYGNMFSIWDQLFGTAKFTRKYPTELGLMNDPKEEWTASWFYPFIKSKNQQSEISKGYRKESNKKMEPTTVQLEAGKTYLWCQCGFSKNQPFCDGSHHGTKHKPKAFQVKRDRKAKLCNCKLTKTGPFCDNSHIQVEELKA